MSDYTHLFGQAPEAEARAHGRVNLLGEHTDYNDGFVLPTAIPQCTRVEVGHSPDGRHHFHSADLREWVDVADGAPTPHGFASYIFGCIKMLEESGFAIPPVNIFVTSDVPIGAGLSSSAALEVATLRALRTLLKLELDDVTLALLAQQAEIRYAGVECGIMDQMASSLADTQHMLFLDTRTLERKVLPFPEGADVLVLDSGVPRTLAGSGYNQRRAECEQAARLLGVPALRDVKDPAVTEQLPEPLRRRARHVITENNRVLEAVAGVSAERFGELMNASHASLRDDYEVSVPALDQLVELLQKTAGVYGARLTGAGFGGACVGLVKQGSAQWIAREVIIRFNRAEHTGRVLVPLGG